MKTIALWAGLALFVSACSTVPQQDAADLPDSLKAQLLDTTMDIGLAQQIATNCPTYAINNTAVAAKSDELGAAFAAAGYGPEVADALGQSVVAEFGDEVQSRTLSYMGANNISPDSPQTWCGAGSREISSGSEIGQLLARSN